MGNILSGVQDAKPTYMTEPYIGKATVKSWETSETMKNASAYKGSPFVKFRLTTENGLPGEAVFWMPKPDDSAEKANGKNLRLKKFLYNCGVDVDNTPIDKLLDSAIGGQLHCAFAKRAYIGKEKDTKRPIERTKVELAFSNHKDKPFNGSININSLVRGLSEDMKAKLKIQQDKWNADNANSAPAPASQPQASNTHPTAESINNASDIDDLDDDDDLPF